MLAAFALRLAFGLCACLLILPPGLVNPRYFRTHFLTILGLAAVAGIMLRDSVGITSWVGLGATLLFAFLGSVSWSLEGAPGGRTLAMLGVASLGVTLYSSSNATSAWKSADDLTSALLLGSALSAMLMGHMYLISPTMTMTPLMRLLGVLFGALLLRMALCGVGLWSWSQTHRITNLEDETVLWLPLRWGLGFVAPLVLSWMAWQTAKIKSTQSATGILYVVVIFCFLGELTSQLLCDNGRYVL